MRMIITYTHTHTHTDTHTHTNTYVFIHMYMLYICEYMLYNIYIYIHIYTLIYICSSAAPPRRVTKINSWKKKTSKSRGRCNRVHQQHKPPSVGPAEKTNQKKKLKKSPYSSAAPPTARWSSSAARSETLKKNGVKSQCPTIFFFGNTFFGNTKVSALLFFFLATH